MRVALYARVSTDKQAEKYGITSQIEALRKRCLEWSWTLVLDGDKDAFIDDGYSGAELDRPGLGRLRQAIREKPFYLRKAKSSGWLRKRTIWRR